MTKEVKPQRIFLVHQHGRRLVVLAHLYSRCYVMLEILYGAARYL